MTARLATQTADGALRRSVGTSACRLRDGVEQLVGAPAFELHRRLG